MSFKIRTTIDTDNNIWGWGESFYRENGIDKGDYVLLSIIVPNDKIKANKLYCNPMEKGTGDDIYIIDINDKLWTINDRKVESCPNILSPTLEIKKYNNLTISSIYFCEFYSNIVGIGLLK